MMHVIRKTLKRLNLTGNEIFMKIRKIAFSIKLPRVCKLTQGKKMSLLLPLLGKSVFYGTS